MPFSAPLLPRKPQRIYAFGSFLERFIANLIDTWLSLLIVPIFINLIIYFAQGQTIGYKLMGLRIRMKTSPQDMPSLGDLFKRSISKTLITFWVAAVLALLIIFLFRIFGRGILPVRSSIRLFFIIAFILGTILTWVQMVMNPQKQSMYDQLGGTVVIKEERSRFAKIFSGILGGISLVTITILFYVVFYMTLDLTTYYVFDPAAKQTLTNFKTAISSPITNNKVVRNATIFVSYYIDPNSSFGSAYANLGVGNNSSKKIVLKTPSTTHNAARENNNDDDIVPETPPSFLQESLKQYQAYRDKMKTQEPTAKPEEKSTTRAAPIPAVEEIIIANELDVAYSLRYVIDFKQAQKSFTTSKSDKTNTLTQINSLFGKQEIRVTPEGVFLKDEISQRTKIKNDNKAREQFQYLYSRRALLPLLRNGNVEGMTYRNGQDVYKITVSSSATDDLPLLFTQHMGNEAVSRINLTLFADPINLALMGWNFEMYLWSNKYTWFLTISYDVDSVQVSTPNDYIQQ